MTLSGQGQHHRRAAGGAQGETGCRDLLQAALTRASPGARAGHNAQTQAHGQDHGKRRWIVASRGGHRLQGGEEALGGPRHVTSACFMSKLSHTYTQQSQRTVTPQEGKMETSRDTMGRGGPQPPGGGEQPCQRQGVSLQESQGPSALASTPGGTKGLGELSPVASSPPPPGGPERGVVLTARPGLGNWGSSRQTAQQEDRTPAAGRQRHRGPCQGTNGKCKETGDWCAVRLGKV